MIPPDPRDEELKEIAAWEEDPALMARYVLDLMNRVTKLEAIVIPNRPGGEAR